MGLQSDEGGTSAAPKAFRYAAATRSRSDSGFSGSRPPGAPRVISEDQYRRRARSARRLADSISDVDLGRTLRTYACECDAAADAMLVRSRRSADR